MKISLLELFLGQNEIVGFSLLIIKKGEFTRSLFGVAEGIIEYSKDGKLMKYSAYKEPKSWSDMPRSPRDAYIQFWTDINGKNNWDNNPFVLVIKFKVLSTTGKPQTI